MLKATIAVLAACLSLPAAAQEATTVADVAKAPANFVGKEVVIADCLLLSVNTIVGGQCTTFPMDPSVLVYIDADTWTDGGDVALACDTVDITKLCSLEVTGDVALDGRGMALIKNARLLEVGRGPAF